MGLGARLRLSLRVEEGAVGLINHREDFAIVAVLRRARRDGHAQWLAAVRACVASGVVQ